MKEYIIYTIEGYTQTPKGEDIENCQILGSANAATFEEAKMRFLEENPWIKRCGYDEIIICEVVGPTHMTCL